MKVPESELVKIIREEARKVIVNELGPQHDFRADPEDRAQTFIDYLGEELRGVVDAHISTDPIDRRSGRYQAVIEISERDMESSRLTPQELKKRVENVAWNSEIVQSIDGVDYFEPSRRHEFYGFEIPFTA